MAKYSEIEIFEGLRNGDSKIIAYLWNEYAPRLQYFAENLIRNKEEAEEIVSTVFLNLPKASARLTSVDHIKASLYISAKNKCVDYLRRKVTQQKQQLHYESYVSKAVEPEESPAERIFLRAELIDSIHKEMKKLPGNCRRVFELAYMDGLSTHEISVKLNINTSTVHSHRFRAINHLRKVLSHKEIIMLLILLT